MKTCYIVGAGDCASLTFEKQPADLVIAADGGLRYLEQAGITPDLVLGDFDSLGYVPQAESILQLPVEKDLTDLQAAVNYARERGYCRFRFYGALGGNRISHSIANLQMLCALAEANCDAEMVDPHCRALALHSGTLCLPAQEHGFVSVFAGNDHCLGVTIHGLKYPLKNHTLDQRFPLGVSNEFVGLPAELSVQDGTLLIILEQ